MIHQPTHPPPTNHPPTQFDTVMRLVEDYDRGEPQGLRQQCEGSVLLELRPYQRHALAFQLEEEQAEGGSARHLWVKWCLPNAPEIPCYVSPVLRQIRVGRWAGGPEGWGGRRGGAGGGVPRLWEHAQCPPTSPAPSRPHTRHAAPPPRLPGLHLQAGHGALGGPGGGLHLVRPPDGHGQDGGGGCHHAAQQAPPHVAPPPPLAQPPRQRPPE